MDEPSEPSALLPRPGGEDTASSSLPANQAGLRQSEGESTLTPYMIGLREWLEIGLISSGESSCPDPPVTPRRSLPSTVENSPDSISSPGVGRTAAYAATRDPAFHEMSYPLSPSSGSVSAASFRSNPIAWSGIGHPSPPSFRFSSSDSRERIIQPDPGSSQMDASIVPTGPGHSSHTRATSSTSTFTLRTPSEDVARLLVQFAPELALVAPALGALFTTATYEQALADRLQLRNRARPTPDTTGLQLWRFVLDCLPGQHLTVNRHGLSLLESVMHCYGLGPTPPVLVYRSDREIPYEVPTDDFWTVLPTKSHTGVYESPLHEGDVWRATVAPRLARIVRGIGHPCHIEVTRYVIRDKYERYLAPGPVTISIRIHTSPSSVHRDTFGELADFAHEHTPSIIALLTRYGLKVPVVEWLESPLRLAADFLLSESDLGSYPGLAQTSNLAPPALLPPSTLPGDPSRSSVHRISAAFGIPIAGPHKGQHASAGFFFHQAGRHQDDSQPDRVLVATCCHAVSPDHTEDYVPSPADPVNVTLHSAGLTEEERADWAEYIDDLGKVDEWVAVMKGSNRRDVVRLTKAVANGEELVEGRLAKLKTSGSSTAKQLYDEGVTDLASVQEELRCAQNALAAWEARSEQLKAMNIAMPAWAPPEARRLGQLEWAPKVGAASVDDEMYVMDLATFIADPGMCRPAFAGNVLDLGYDAEIESSLLQETFGPNFKYPPNGLLKMRGVLDREDIRRGCKDQDCLVLKDGRTTGLTVGLMSSLEVIECKPSGFAFALAVKNYPMRRPQTRKIYPTLVAPVFVRPGDSGSMAVDPSGKMVGVVHSQDVNCDIHYLTPAWVIQRLVSDQYPGAVFDKETWS